MIFLSFLLSHTDISYQISSRETHDMFQDMQQPDHFHFHSGMGAALVAELYGAQ